MVLFCVQDGPIGTVVTIRCLQCCYTMVQREAASFAVHDTIRCIFADSLNRIPVFFSNLHHCMPALKTPNGVGGTNCFSQHTNGHHKIKIKIKMFLMSKRETRFEPGFIGSKGQHSTNSTIGLLFANNCKWQILLYKLVVRLLGLSLLLRCSYHDLTSHCMELKFMSSF
jgi:hypothetical protein